MEESWTHSKTLAFFIMASVWSVMPITVESKIASALGAFYSGVPSSSKIVELWVCRQHLDLQSYLWGTHGHSLNNFRRLLYNQHRLKQSSFCFSSFAKQVKTMLRCLAPQQARSANIGLISLNNSGQAKPAPNMRLVKMLANLGRTLRLTLKRSQVA